MPAELHWHLDPFVLYVQEYGAVQDKDLHAVNRDLLAVLDQVPYDMAPVHLILDHSQLEQRTPNIDLLKETLEVFSHPALGWTVVVSEDTVLWRFLSSAAAQYSAARMERVRTVENALSFLGSIDNRLGELLNGQ